jgi:hypothetical protein
MKLNSYHKSSKIDVGAYFFNFSLEEAYFRRGPVLKKAYFGGANFRRFTIYALFYRISGLKLGFLESVD